MHRSSIHSIRTARGVLGNKIDWKILQFTIPTDKNVKERNNEATKNY